ncbi:uncharacterized protein LOC127749610 isoform X2 [Frankliniella occidentalis]|uniref:Uncharacterized protein LOC127749610 isoform X2 n=1 Tax=Frankliniella occidentalis TaxID=133901 RepID=A0A9C6U726_FRAOC|nr:uncharacterized protein LOC127749610 isoform X2 [Frankliniella occidentalis]
MTPIIAVFMSMISLLALVADRANLQEQGEAIPLPSVDDGVSRNFLDVAKRTLPLKMTPARSINLRRVPRAAAGPGAASVYVLRSGPGPGPGAPPGARRRRGLGDHDADAVLLQSLLLSALRERYLQGHLAAPSSASSTSAPGAPGRWSPKTPHGAPQPPPAPQPRANSLGDLREDIMMHGRDRDQLRRRWKIESAGNRVASAHHGLAPPARPARP